VLNVCINIAISDWNVLLRVDKPLQVIGVVHRLLQSQWCNPRQDGINNLLLVLNPLTHPKHVPIGVSQVHLADVPPHVVRWKGDLQPGVNALLVGLVDVVHPDRHPDAFVTGFVSFFLERSGVRSAAAASLRSMAKEDLAFVA
jgi:hypothetical protein